MYLQLSHQSRLKCSHQNIRIQFISTGLNQEKWKQKTTAEYPLIWGNFVVFAWRKWCSVRKLVSSGPKERTLRKARSILADLSHHLQVYFVLFPSGRRYGVPRPGADVEKYLWGGKRGTGIFEGWQHVADIYTGQLLGILSPECSRLSPDADSAVLPLPSCVSFPRDSGSLDSRESRRSVS